MILEVEMKRGCRARVRNRNIRHREVFLVDVEVVAELWFGGGSLALLRTSCQLSKNCMENHCKDLTARL